MNLSVPNYLPKAHSPNAITVRVRASIDEVEGREKDTRIQSMIEVLVATS